MINLSRIKDIQSEKTFGVEKMTENDPKIKALMSMIRTSQYIQDRLKSDLSVYHLNFTEYMVLELLFKEGDQPIQYIGRKLLLASSSITYVIDKLEKKGYVRRVPSSTDRRVIYIQMTNQGKQIREDISPNYVSSVRYLFEDYSVEELAQLTQFLDKIKGQPAVKK